MIEPDLRDRILAAPEMLLEDRDVMSALVAANERSFGSNVVDLRAIAMQRLETRLSRLEDTHRSVISAAYENLAGMNLIHRAVLQMLEPQSLAEFLQAMEGEISATLRVDGLAIALEGAEGSDAEGSDIAALSGLSPLLHILAPGEVEAYAPGSATRAVILRQIAEDAPSPIFGDTIRSEAILRLEPVPGGLPGMLVLGSADAGHFRPGQASDLLAFLAKVTERILRRFLA